MGRQHTHRKKAGKQIEQQPTMHFMQCTINSLRIPWFVWHTFRLTCIFCTHHFCPTLCVCVCTFFCVLYSFNCLCGFVAWPFHAQFDSGVFVLRNSVCHRFSIVKCDNNLISIDFNNKNVMRCAFVCPVFDTLQFNIDSQFIYIVYANAYCCLNIVSVLFSQFFFFFWFYRRQNDWLRCHIWYSYL